MQDETSSAIEGEPIMEDEGYPTVQNPYSTKPLYITSLRNVFLIIVALTGCIPIH